MRQFGGRLVVLIDGGCPMCRRTARVLHGLDWFNRLAFVDGTDAAVRERYAPGLSDAAVMLEMYVVDETGARRAGYEGYLRMAAVVPALWPLGTVGRLPGLRHAGRVAYRFVASRRRRRGRCTEQECATVPGPSLPRRV